MEAQMGYCTTSMWIYVKFHENHDFGGGHLGFFQCGHIWMVHHAWECFYLIPWPRKHRVRDQKHLPTLTISRNNAVIRFCGGHFEKWPKWIAQTKIFTVTSWFHIKDTLRLPKKLEWLNGGGVHEGPIWPMAYEYRHQHKAAVAADRDMDKQDFGWRPFWNSRWRPWVK